MRVVLITLLVAACGEPKLIMKPLPPLAEPQARTPLREIVVGDIGLDPGDSWIWDVQVKGFSIGRVELHVASEEILSRFRTNALASTVANVEHDLQTIVDRDSARPHLSSERLELGGKLRQFNTQYAGTTAHSFHTALGAIRVWARPDAVPGFLLVVHADQVFRLELQRPSVQQTLLRIDGRVIGQEVDLGLSIWLDAARVPTRIEIRDGDDRVTAELITD
ncbi:MAG TPA: hypothetical protein VIV40_21090 [Kofleriaceae bacterium]